MKRKQTVRFTKMQGCGNDYVYIDCFSEELPDIPGGLSELARRISDRHYGIGGDGLILIEPSDGADARMRMFNSDGSEGNMCGNGIRCLARYIYSHGLVPLSRSPAVIETKSGLRTVALTPENSISVDMGTPALTGPLPEEITIRGMRLAFIGVDVGSPHAVYFLEDNSALGVSHVSELELAGLGHDFETHQRFPDRVNSEFIETLNPTEIKLRVWERGSGETLACGTGATAAVFAGTLAGKLNGGDGVLVHLAGGDLCIRCDRDSGHCIMTGPAEEVFSGEFKI